MACNPDIYKPRQGTKPAIGSLRWVQRDRQIEGVDFDVTLVLQQYQPSTSKFTNDWFDVGVFDEETGLAVEGQDVG